MTTNELKPTDREAVADVLRKVVTAERERCAQIAWKVQERAIAAANDPHTYRLNYKTPFRELERFLSGKQHAANEIRDLIRNGQ